MLIDSSSVTEVTEVGRTRGPIVPPISGRGNVGVWEFQRTLAEGGWELAEGGWELAEGGWELAEGGWELAEGGWELAEGGWGLAQRAPRQDLLGAACG
jgi:hypothetical protein